MKSNLPVINHRLFKLRELNENDTLDYFFLVSSFETCRYLTFGPVSNVSEARLCLDKFYFSRQKMGLPGAYAIVNKKDEMIGIIEYHTYFVQTNCAELGFILREDYRHKGIMTCALKEMIKVGFLYLGLSKIIVGHVDLNEECEGLVKRVGFKYEFTRYGEFETKDTHEKRNIIYYSMYKEEYEGLINE